MKKTVWTFGLIAGGILSAMMLVTIPFFKQIGPDTAEVIGYTTIVVACLLIFFGVRAHRDSSPGGTIGFGRALLVGILINVVASACYVVTWEVLYYNMNPRFEDTYSTMMIEREREKGSSEAEIAALTAEMEKFQEWYKNPFLNVGVTFLEPFTVGTIGSLVSAGVLRRRRRFEEAVA